MLLRNIAKGVSRCQSQLSRTGSMATTHFRHMSTVQKDSNDEFNSKDGLFEEFGQVDKSESLDPTGRSHYYFLTGVNRLVNASLIRMGVVKVVGSLSASADVLALSTVEVDISKIEEGMCLTTKWRGKPVFIKHRSEEEIEKSKADDGAADLRDKETDADRCKDPKWMVVLGICTHLGCVPLSNQGEWGGWFCPCHGSHYDLSGRIRKGPAPLNLDVPSYKFVDSKTILLG